MMDLGVWLRSLGLGQYEAAFRENAIDATILHDLTEDHLRELGFPLGARLKLLKGIAALNASATSVALPIDKVTGQTVAAPLQATDHRRTEAAGERRYLTVMFCDLVGSTAISSQLDAEEWRDLVGAYLDAASAAVTEMGGHVAKKLGDGILALFGYPLAHENDSERAARAALSIQRALTDLNRKNAESGTPELKARIGLETGPAVVDAAGEIYGDVANVAARVQSAAEPGAVLVTARVQRLVAGLFVAEDRGVHTLKGVPEPMALFKLVRASGGGRRTGQRQLTSLVGRDDEMMMIMRRWERARAGDGQLMLIVGEPGLGKSRLIGELRTRFSDTPHTWIEWTCSQLLQNTPLHPIAEWGRQRFGGADVPSERRLAELESSLAQLKLDPAESALLAPLLDIPLPSGRAPALAAEEFRRRQLAALTNWVMAGARVQPVVLVLEDLQWADPTTVDVLRALAERSALVPLLVLATARPEFRAPWSMRSHHSTISLAPLDRSQVRDMVAELSARHALPRDVVEDVATRTGGVPLFIEEVTRLLLEPGDQGGMQAIPPTLQQSLMARLDRLGPAREVAQIGSVIGRGFSYALLRAVTGMDDAALQVELERLADADILLVQGSPPVADYRFKHALIQDAAYENLLKSRRQILHRRVAETLRDNFTAIAATEPELLAHQFTQAGMTAAAIDWWGKAGDQALRRSAFQEAIAHLGKAIEMADKDAESPQRSTQSAPTSLDRRLRLQTNYGHAIAMFRGFTSDETKAAFTKAQQLLAGIDDPSERYRTYSGLWLASFSHGDVASAREIAETFWRDAENTSRISETAFALAVLGATCFMQGDFGKALRHLQNAIQIYDAQRDREAKFLFDTGAFAAQYLALAHWVLGEGEEAREVIGDARRRAIESAQAPALAMQYLVEAIHEALRGDAMAARRAAELCIDVSRAHGVAVFLSDGIGYLGWARAEFEDRKAGIAQLNECISTHVEQGNRVYIPVFQGLLSEIERREEGGLVAGLKRIDEAIALTSEMGTRWCEAFLLHIRGKILLNFNPASPEAAENAFLAAIAIAQQQKARSFELHAALSLAKFYQSTSRAADAHAVLAAALEGFLATPEFLEIEEAGQLLAALE